MRGGINSAVALPMTATMAKIPGQLTGHLPKRRRKKAIPTVWNEEKLVSLKNLWPRKLYIVYIVKGWDEMNPLGKSSGNHIMFSLYLHCRYTIIEDFKCWVWKLRQLLRAGLVLSTGRNWARLPGSIFFQTRKPNALSRQDKISCLAVKIRIFLMSSTLFANMI